MRRRNGLYTIKKRRALRGKQRVVLLINSAGKRTVVLLNPSFFYFFNPFFVMRHAWRQCELQLDCKKFTIALTNGDAENRIE